MGRFRYAETASGQAAVLFVAAGGLGLLSEVVPGSTYGGGLRIVNGTALVFGLVISQLPWHRWPSTATLTLIPAAFALIVLGRWHDPTGVGVLYALWFVVVFGWIGSWHPPRTALVSAPLGAIAYVIPFLPGAPAESPESLGTVTIAIPIAVVVAEVLSARSGAMRRTQAALEASAQLLERANLTDDLTGVGNRRQANALLDSMEPGDGLVLLDLDHFKAVNDSRGHAEGDRVLMVLGSYLLNSLRDADCVARYGGEEFLILLRGAGADAGAIVARLLAGWRGTGCGVTISAGVAVHTSRCTPDDTLKRTDRMLYRAKAEGRDRVMTERSYAARRPPMRVPLMAGDTRRREH